MNTDSYANGDHTAPRSDVEAASDARLEAVRVIRAEAAALQVVTNICLLLLGFFWGYRQVINRSTKNNAPHIE
jgi:hypothetical protein